MSKVESFEDLIVWQEARELVKLVYQSFHQLKDYSFKDQIQRAAISIMNNIAEGFERGSNAEFIRFLNISKASAGEVRSMTYIAKDLDYITSEIETDIHNRARKLSGSIKNLIKYLRSSNIK